MSHSVRDKVGKLTTHLESFEATLKKLKTHLDVITSKVNRIDNDVKALKKK